MVAEAGFGPGAALFEWILGASVIPEPRGNSLNMLHQFLDKPLLNPNSSNLFMDAIFLTNKKVVHKLHTREIKQCTMNK